MIAEEKKKAPVYLCINCFQIFFRIEFSVFHDCALRKSRNCCLQTQSFEQGLRLPHNTLKKKEEIYSNHLLGKRFGRRGRVDLEKLYLPLLEGENSLNIYCK